MILDVRLKGVKVAEVDERDEERLRTLRQDKSLVFVPQDAGERAAEAAENIAKSRRLPETQKDN